MRNVDRGEERRNEAVRQEGAMAGECDSQVSNGGMYGI